MKHPTRVLLLDRHSPRLLQLALTLSGDRPDHVFTSTTHDQAVHLAQQFRPAVILVASDCVYRDGSYFPEILKEYAPESQVIVAVSSK